MIPTLFSVSYAGLWGQQKLDIESFIKKAAVLGFEAVELMAMRPHLSILDTDAAKIANIKRCARENNIKIVTLAGQSSMEFILAYRIITIPLSPPMRSSNFSTMSTIRIARRCSTPGRRPCKTKTFMPAPRHSRRAWYRPRSQTMCG